MNLICEDMELLPLRDVVFRTIRQEILTGKLKPGERLREIVISEQMGVSRTPVREAIRMLELEGLVKTFPRRGAEVADITKKELMDVLEVRNALEKLAIELACERISKEQIQKLKDNVAEFETAMEEKDPEKLAMIDEEFHFSIIEATGNDRLIQLLNNIRQQMYRFRFEYLKKEEVYRQLLKEHIEIIENIEEGNVRKATSKMASHINKQVSLISQG